MKNILKRKSRNRIFSLNKFFSWTQSFLGQNSEKMAKSKNLGRKFFWSVFARMSDYCPAQKPFKILLDYSLAPKPLKITSNYCLAPKRSDQTVARPGAHLLCIINVQGYIERFIVSNITFQ